MNVENIRKVRDAIAAAPPEKLGMDDVFSGPLNTAGDLLHMCGTAGCIAGWTLAVFDPTGIPAGMDRAGALLGLNDVDAAELFLAKKVPVPLSFFGQSDALAVLDHLLATGKVDWSVADSVPA